MWNIKAGLTVFLFCLLPFCVLAQEAGPADPFQGFPELVEGLIAKWRVPGMAVGVVRNGEIPYMQGFGYRDLERRLPVTTKTVFGIGSISSPTSRGRSKNWKWRCSRA